MNAISATSLDATNIILPSPESAEPEASSSAPTRPLCAVCNHRYSIYTCPRCSTRTCSLPCSTTHKSNKGCSGERNKTVYVPMNQYRWGTMMDDYVFLEDVGRRVGDWGKEIVRGGFGVRGMNDTRESGRGGAERGRGKGRGRGDWGNGGGRTKRDVLKMQLESRDIDVDLLPVGMERRKVNQSSWDFKKQTALLTIEFKFHPPPDPLAPASQPRDPPFIILTHRNDLKTPLLTLIQAHVTKSKKDNALPIWVKPLVFADPDDPDSFTPPQCLMTAQVDPISLVLSGTQPKAGYYRLDTTKTLAILLRHTHFVEFPTIEVWEEFRGTIVDEQGAVTEHAEEERKPKRRKMDQKAGKKAINGLLGGYGSEDEDEADAHNVLSMLGGYAGSDDEEEGGVAGIEDDLGDEDAEGETDDEVELNQDALLALMRQAKGNEKWTGDVSDDDLVDWGDSGEDEPE